MNPIKALIYYDAVVSNRDDLVAENAHLRAELAAERAKSAERLSNMMDAMARAGSAEIAVDKMRQALEQIAERDQQIVPGGIDYDAHLRVGECGKIARAVLEETKL